LVHFLRENLVREEEREKREEEELAADCSSGSDAIARPSPVCSRSSTYATDANAESSDAAANDDAEPSDATRCRNCTRMYSTNVCFG
jgi:hypothetical protein